MLFNSLPFIFLFLPVTLILFYAIARTNHRLAAVFLALASLCFYGWWDSRYILLLIGSICGNFILSEAILRNRTRPHTARTLLAVAIAADLMLLGYYKYTTSLSQTSTLFPGRLGQCGTSFCRSVFHFSPSPKSRF
jgi:D-alanyl-lipoteichoic acid acyltransferase DltB (MBOAT superfamily)